MTTSPIDRLHAEVGELAAAWTAAQPALGAAPDSDAVGERAFEALSGDGLVRVVERAARLKRAVESFLARAGTEVARRSAPEFGADGLAKRYGHSSPARLVASATGGGQGEAARLLAVGEATRAGESFTGEATPAKYAYVRAGLDAGALSIEAANLITGMLRRVELRADAGLIGSYEQRLVGVAVGAPLSLVGRAVKEAEATLDAEGLARSDERMREERSLTFREDADGVFHLRARLDPVTAAPVKAALDALVSDALRRRGSGGTATAGGAGDDGRGRGRGRDQGAGAGADAGGVGAVIEDRRSIPQVQADALAELARHALGCQAAPGSVPATTIVVRMSLEALREGVGVAEIDGIDRPVAAGTVRKLAADAELIPAVLGSDSVPLDLGRGTRLFSRSQRLALMERDGGCASCGANITYAEAHHVEWWSRGGPTDLANGVMLCASCHHQIHDQGWQVRITGKGRRGQVWFIPPPHLDPDQTPRLGGKARFSPKRERPPSPAPAPGRAPGSRSVPAPARTGTAASPSCDARPPRVLRLGQQQTTT
ncbi:HNH endonuclease [Agromyces silvae]|uniref:HNH endonuclease n=1 Tax=Agromyces silvae TaxID=3388266 RepID=UPI00280AA022|nr:DUF222 domain-containing protein [Agromyces protaetiae]